MMFLICQFSVLQKHQDSFVDAWKWILSRFNQKHVQTRWQIVTSFVKIINPKGLCVIAFQLQTVGMRRTLTMLEESQIGRKTFLHREKRKNIAFCESSFQIQPGDPCLFEALGSVYYICLCVIIVLIQLTINYCNITAIHVLFLANLIL